MSTSKATSELEPEVLDTDTDQVDTTEAELAAAEEEHDNLEEEANEALGAQYDEAPFKMSEPAWTVGNRLLSACHDELAAAGIRQSSETKQILSRLERRIKTELLQGYREILGGTQPSVLATLKKVTFGGGKVVGSLEIDKNTEERHELADFADRDVLVVLADDIDEHMDGMQELVDGLSEMQTELPLGLPGPGEPLTPGQVSTIIHNGEPCVSDTDEHIAKLLVGDVEGMARTDMDQLAYKLAIEIETLDINLEEIELWSDEHIVDYIAHARGKLAEMDSDAADVAAEQSAIDESRLIVKDGEVVGVAPDPDCEICSGAGGWDVATDTEEGVDEWVECECVQLPGESS